MHKPIVVRQAKESDACAVERLYHELVTDPRIQVLPERLLEIAADPNSFLLVAELSGTIRATAFLTLCLDAMYGKQPYAVLENVVVASDSRGAGIGRLLMSEVERLCRAHDCSKLMLLSSSRRLEAHAFFRAMGFSGDHKQGFVKYRRQLGAVPDGKA